MITVQVNGSPRVLVSKKNLAELVEELSGNVEPHGVAVAVNEQIVRRAEWPQTPIHDGDVVEIVRATQGG